jgi:hypothetical protein
MQKSRVEETRYMVHPIALLPSNLPPTATGDPGDLTRTPPPHSPKWSAPIAACQHSPDVLCFREQAGVADAAAGALCTLHHTDDPAC